MEVRRHRRWWLAPGYFLVSYFLRFGLLDGFPGFGFALLKWIYFFQIRLKIIELENARTRRGLISLASDSDGRRLELPHGDLVARIPHGHGPGLRVAHRDRGGPEHRPFADGHAGHDERPCADERVFADVDGADDEGQGGTDRS